jgi:hypothetical protein
VGRGVVGADHLDPERSERTSRFGLECPITCNEMNAARLAAGMAAVTLALTACSAPPPKLPIGHLVDPGQDGSTDSDFVSSTFLRGGQGSRATGIARFIQRKYDLVEVWGINSQEDVVSYAVRMRLDPRSDHPDFEDWQAHVSQAVRDQRQASVEMLKLTVRRIRRAGMVSVFQDEFLQPMWSREQILAMERPQAYRDFEAWQDLVLSAAFLPGFSPQ